MKRTILLLLALVMCLSLCACGGSEAKLATIVDNEGNTVQMSHDELQAIHDENQIKFEKYYVGADITFVGTVQSIKTGIHAGTGVLYDICWDTIEFEEGWRADVHHGSYDDILAELSAGDKLKVESQIHDGFIYVEVSGCNTDGSRTVEDLKQTKLTIVE